MLKRTLAVVLALAIMMTAGAFAAFAENDDLEILPGFDFKQGDVNLDNGVNIKDVTLIQKILAKIKEVGEHQLSLADVDGKSGLSIKDATHLQKWIADLVEELYSPEGALPQETTASETLPNFGGSVTISATKVTEIVSEIPESSAAEETTEAETIASESATTDPEETTKADDTEAASSSEESEPTEPEVITTAETVVTDPEEVTSSVAPTESDAATEATSEATEATETTTKVTIITLPFIPAL